MTNEVREIVITIKGDGSGTAEPKTKNEAWGGPDYERMSAESEAERSARNEVVASVLANQAFQYAKSEIMAQANYENGKYFSLTDDYLSARDQSIAISIIGKGMGLVTAVGAGFSIGGPIGAVLAGVGKIGTDMMSAFRAVDAQQLGIDKANAQLAYTMSRRGAVLTDDSIGENR